MYKRVLNLHNTAMIMPKKQRSVIIEGDAWQLLKVFCAQNELNVVDKGGTIIEEWVQENCESYPAD